MQVCTEQNTFNQLAYDCTIALLSLGVMQSVLTDRRKGDIGCIGNVTHVDKINNCNSHYQFLLIVLRLLTEEK